MQMNESLNKFRNREEDMVLEMRRGKHTLCVELRRGERWELKPGESFRTLEDGSGVISRTYKELKDGEEESKEESV